MKLITLTKRDDGLKVSFLDEGVNVVLEKAAEGLSYATLSFYNGEFLDVAESYEAVTALVYKKHCRD
jgi:hypothetical protein